MEGVFDNVPLDNSDLAQAENIMFDDLEAEDLPFSPLVDTPPPPPPELTLHDYSHLTKTTLTTEYSSDGSRSRSSRCLHVTKDTIATPTDSLEEDKQSTVPV